MVLQALQGNIPWINGIKQLYLPQKYTTMIFHPSFCKRKIDICDTPDWFEQRAKLYAEVAKWGYRKPDEIYFGFSDPDSGWIDITIYINGKKVHTFPISQAFDPFFQLKVWMEDIVNDTKLSTDINIEVEGRTIIFHYEHIRHAEFGSGRKFITDDYELDEWEDYDANTHPDTGLFYLYDSGMYEMPVICYCNTKQLLFVLYNGLLHYSARSKAVPKFGNDWYYMDHDDEGNPEFDNWEFYNTLKSPLIEWNYDSKEAYRHRWPEFREPVQIKETVHMWFEWGDGLFWHQRGGCCGNAEKFFVDTENTEIDLTGLPELRQWYDEFDESGPLGVDNWTKEHMDEWFNRGWDLAKKIRVMLPECVDLFYQWKSCKCEGSEWGNEEIPIIVPDQRLYIKKQREL